MAVMALLMLPLCTVLVQTQGEVVRLRVSVIFMCVRITKVLHLFFFLRICDTCISNKRQHADEAITALRESYLSKCRFNTVYYFSKNVSFFFFFIKQKPTQIFCLMAAISRKCFWCSKDNYPASKNYNAN